MRGYMIEGRSKPLLPATAAVLSLLASSAGAQEPAVQEQPEPKPGEVSAIWKAQEIAFHFQSFSTFYSCDGLARKLERILEAVGAEADVRVTSPECPTEIARMPRVVMQVRMPVEATPEALAARDKNKSTRELKARLKGTDPNEGLEQFPAKWQRLSLGPKLRLQAGDCELIEEFRRKVLPKLAVRLVDGNLQCAPNSSALVRPKLEVEALIALPTPDTPQAKDQTPEAKDQSPTDKPEDEQGTNTGSAR
jgi:hypothetical protein